VRGPFEAFSTVTANLARGADFQRQKLVNIYECAMAPATRHARWVQRAGSVKRNPFFGATMPDCGDAVKDPPPPAAP